MDLLDKVRVAAEQQMACYQDLMANHYNNKIKPWYFKVGDLVLRKVTIATKDPHIRQARPQLGKTLQIIDCYRRSTYHQETLNRQRLHHPWNAEYLRR